MEHPRSGRGGEMKIKVHSIKALNVLLGCKNLHEEQKDVLEFAMTELESMRTRLEQALAEIEKLKFRN
jgi:cell division protein ZapA (FtsZ GTPase activity inhibitor)